MATLSQEFVGYHDASAKHDVSVTIGEITPGDTSTTGERNWLATVTLPYTVVNTTAVSANQDSLQDVIDEFARVDAGSATTYDLYASQGIGQQSGV